MRELCDDLDAILAAKDRRIEELEGYIEAERAVSRGRLEALVMFKRSLDPHATDETRYEILRADADGALDHGHKAGIEESPHA